MPYAVLIASQRSGTSALASLLRNALDMDCLGEVLDPSLQGPAISETDGMPTLPRVKDALRQWHESPRTSLLDIKINLLNSVGALWRSPAMPPALFDLFAADKAKIIWLDRPAAEQWVSGQLALQSNIWHHTAPIETAVEPATVDPWELHSFLEIRAKEDRLLETWLEDFPVLKLSYDEVFGPDADGSIVPRIAAFLGVSTLPGWESARPAIYKIAKPVLEANIANLEEVRHLLPFSRAPETPDSLSKSPLDFDALPQPLQVRVRRRQRDLLVFENEGVLEQKHYQDRVVLDWECGDAAFAMAFAIGGAAHVYAADSWLNMDLVPSTLKNAERIRLRKAAIGQYAHEIHGAVDLVFANTVTEHVQNVPADFAEIYKVLRSGGCMFINHDNYYHPVGSHDHGLLFYGSKEIEAQGPKCWEMPGKCAESQAYRKAMTQRFPWTWDARNEGKLDPAHCEACHYFKRSQPWAHLLYQNEFATLFPQHGFTTGQPQSSLNKLTIFQLRQLIVEAGFLIEKEYFAKVKNEPPEELLKGPHHFTKFDLQTPMYRVLARKA